MTYYAVSRSSELMHHGVKGQKWGVRRYQNYDGTLKHPKTKSKEFKDAEADVLKRLTMNHKNFKKEPIDYSVIQQRGKLSKKEAMQCATIADKLYKRASSMEPQITEDVISAVSKSDGKMYGLDFRLKQPNSIAAKVGSDAKEKNVSFEEAGKSINDTIRYTAVSKNKSYSANYNVIKEGLEAKGYREIKCKNYFDLYSKGQVMHKAVQSVFANDRGDTFEFQFHTPSSQAAKELKLPIYNERRKAGISSERAKALEGQMKDLAESVENPKSVYSIRSH